MSNPEKHQLIICPIHQTYFSGRLWMGLDCKIIQEFLVESLPDFDIKVLSLSNIANDLSILEKNCTLFISSSYDKAYQKYICDVARHISLDRPDVLLIPSYDMLLAHENKGYQELVKKRIGVAELKGDYFGDISDFDITKKKNFPYVVKLLEGAMSSNVFLAKNHQDLTSKLKENGNRNLRYRLKRLFKKYIIWRRYNNVSKSLYIKNYDEFFCNRTPFIVQDFVPNLTYDYKVLVFGSKYFVLKRYVRENDFRASGSGNFTYETPSRAVLDYAKKVFDLLDTPFVSLDIAERDGNCYLIEYQGIGFGPITLENSTGFYTYSEQGDTGSWTFIDEDPDLERSYADALRSFIKKPEELEIIDNKNE